MNKIFQWFNERTQTEKVGLIGIVLVGVGFFVYQIYNQRAEINRLEKELREVQNLQAFYLEKRRLERELEKLKEGVTLYRLSYEEIYKTARQNNITILETKKLKAKRFFINITNEKVILSSDTQRRQTRGRENRKKQPQQRKKGTIIAEPVNLKLMGNKENVVSFLEELTRDKLVAFSGFYSGCITASNFERLKAPPNMCNLKVNSYKNWLCSKVNQNKFYLTLLLLQVRE